MSEWKGVVTKAGYAAQEESMATGAALVINSVKVGTGTVDEADMRDATGLKAQVGSGTLVKKEMTEDGVLITMGIVPLASAYTIKEVGVFATINSRTVMMALYQKTDGIDVPSSSSFPDYFYRLTAVWDVGNLDQMTIQVDTSALVSQQDLADGLQTKIDLDQGVSNAGKFLIVGNDGIVTPVTVPFAEGVSF